MDSLVNNGVGTPYGITANFRSRPRSRSSKKSVDGSDSRSRSRSPITSKVNYTEQQSRKRRNEHLATSSDGQPLTVSSGRRASRVTTTRRNLISRSYLNIIDNREEFYPHCHNTDDGSNSPINGWMNVPLDIRSSQPFGLYTVNVSIPSSKLRHVTHPTWSTEINPADGMNDFAFKPFPKYGKTLENDEQGSYVQSDLYPYSYYKINGDEVVLPGRYSWWEIETREGEFAKCAKTLSSNRIFVSPFLANPQESPHGNISYIVDFKHLLECYKESRTDIADVRNRIVYLRIGGTFRYRFEICYVILVCTKQDRELEEYPSLHDSNVFDDKGLVLKKGKIADKFYALEETIDFKPKYVIKCVPKQNYFNYETPAYAFYYPDDKKEYILKCPEEIVTQRTIKHKCTKLCKQKLKQRE